MCANVHAKEQCAPVDATKVSGFFDDWNLALATLDADRVTQRYWPDALLLPISNTPLTNSGSIHEYFEKFLTEHPRARITSRSIQLSCNLAVDMGTYTFSLLDAKGHSSELAAGYTYVYQFRGDAWKILHQHSSAMPELKPDPAKPSATESKAPALALTDNARRVGGTRMFVNIDASPKLETFVPTETPTRRQRASVALQVCAAANGQLLREPEVLSSSGLDELDLAAKAWANAARWIPATQADKPIDSCMQVSVTFPA
jgi:uncharacterized protein (TIGR02246 family)